MSITPTRTLIITRIIAATLCPDIMVAIIGAMDNAIIIVMKAEVIGTAVTGDPMAITDPAQTAGGDK